MVGQILSPKLETDTPLDDEALMELNRMENPFMRLHFIKRNNDIIRKLARRTVAPNYDKIHKTPESSGEEFLVETCKQFARKVILINLWGTWCGPCRSAIKQFEEEHERLTEQGLVTLYVTDEKSPEQDWQNMASGMRGEHFRLKENQTKEIFHKFGFTGWSSYIVIDKQGRYIYTRTSFYQDDMVKAIEQALAE